MELDPLENQLYDHMDVLQFHGALDEHPPFEGISEVRAKGK